jgi:hypothetical protein
MIVIPFFLMKNGTTIYQIGGNFMKLKYLTVATSICLIIAATGCGKVGNEKVNISPTIADAFTVNAELCYDGVDSEAIITRLADGIWQAEFLSPNTLAGVILIFEGENVSANYKGLSFSVPKNALPYKIALTEFFEVTDSVADKSKIQCEKKSGKYVIDGSTDQGGYTLKLDQKSGCVSEFSMPNINLEMKLNDYVSEATPGTSSVTDNEGNTVTNVTDEGGNAVTQTPQGGNSSNGESGNLNGDNGNSLNGESGNSLNGNNGNSLNGENGNTVTQAPEQNGETRTKAPDLPNTADSQSE